MDAWPFADPLNTASITTRQVLEGAPILLVTHDADDGGWQFLCGTTAKPADARVVGLGRMYARDATIGELAELRAELADAASLFHGDHPRMRAVHDANSARLAEILEDPAGLDHLAVPSWRRSVGWRPEPTAPGSP